MSEPLDIDLNALEARSGLSPANLASLHEAAAVVLDRLQTAAAPIAPTRIDSTGAPPRDAVLRWARADGRARDTHANELNAVEDGAAAVAIAAVPCTHRCRVIRRAFHGSGADYLMRAEGATGDDVIRLEVSGVSGVAHPPSRLREKVEELRAGALRRPGVAVVVAFRARPLRILMEDVP
jgi:hypothetical protein